MVVESSGGALSLLSKLKFLVIYTTLFKTVLLLQQGHIAEEMLSCQRRTVSRCTRTSNLRVSMAERMRGDDIRRYMYINRSAIVDDGLPSVKKRGITWCALASTSLMYMRNWQIYKTVTPPGPT